MGYRSYASGDGTVVGGTTEVDLVAEWIMLGSVVRIYQKREVTNSVVSGVSKETAESISATGSASVKGKKVTRTSSGASVWNTAMGVCGTKRRVTYNRISESNLFSVNIEAIKMSASDDGGTTWDANGNM